MDVLPQPTTRPPSFQLKRLSPKHKQVASLLAQGLGREDIARIVGITPEYVTMLSKQALFIEYISDLTKAVDTQLQALFAKGVQVCADVMIGGADTDKLRAAQMVFRAVGKEGVVKVQGTVNHRHSLVGILQTLPPAGANGARDVPILNNPDPRDGRILPG